MKTLAALTLTAATLLTGCNLAPDVTAVEIIDALTITADDDATLDRDRTPWKITGNESWRVVSHTVGTVEIGEAIAQEAGGPVVVLD